MIRSSFVFLLIFSLTLTGCSSTNSKSDFNRSEISSALAEEISIGKEIHTQILSQFHVYTYPKVVSYVRSIGNSIVKHAKREDLPYQFTILYDEKVYATSSFASFILRRIRP